MTGHPTSDKGKRGAGSTVDVALKFLVRRSRTIHELRSHLARKGHAPGRVSAAIEKLTRLGYLDDRALVERYARWAISEKPMGRIRLRRDLLRRGVDRETLEVALAEAFGRADEAEALRRALARAARRIGPEPNRGALRRMASHLLARGFRQEDVKEALDEWWRSLGEREVDE